MTLVTQSMAVSPVSSDVVKRIIKDSLEGAGLPAPFAKLLTLPLEQPGRALADDAPTRWERLIAACAESAGGDEGLVPIVAASFELCIAALDVLDEVEDEDYSPLVEAVGIARAINASTALMAQSQVLLADLPTGGSRPNLPIDFSLALNHAVLAATVGQDEDLQDRNGRTLTVDDALATAKRKSGSLVAGAAVLGAMLGTADESLLSRYWDLGVHFGAMAQIANDIHDARDPLIKSDTRVGKATLPLLFAERSSFASEARRDDDLLDSSGALHFSWVVLEIERRKCLEIVEELRRNGQHVNQLKSMIGG